MKQIYRELALKAREARLNAYAPYSKFGVGSALLTKSGKIFTGCNVESSSYSLTICAERTALFKAVSEGERSFLAIAVASDGPGFTPPCGACRQVLMDITGNIDCIMIDSMDKIKTTKLKLLLPLAFSIVNLEH
ncbi:MAG: cytidine deaminase [Bacteroidota bacterium]